MLRGEERAATSAGEVGREGARRRGAEKWRVSRAGDREREERRRARRAVWDASRVVEKTREAHARGAGGDGRQTTTATRTGETRASRTVTEPRTTMRPPTERCCAASAGVGATPPRTWRTATLLKLDARRRNMATRRLSRQSAAVGARESGPPKGGPIALLARQCWQEDTLVSVRRTGGVGPDSRREFAFARWVRNGTFETSKTEITFRLLPFKYLDDEHSDGSSSGDGPSVAPQSI